MSIQGPSETRGTISKKGSSPLHFLRVMRYSKPYLRFLYPALACVVFVAFTYSLNLVALLPMIKVIVEEQGIPAWTHQYIAEQRLDVSFKDKGGKLSIREIDSDSPLADALPDWDPLTLALARIDDAPLPSDKLLRRLASDDFDGSLRLGFDFIHDGQHVQTEVSVPPRPVPRLHKFARWIVSGLPETNDPDAKMNTLIILLVAVLVVGFTGAICRFFGEYLISLVAGRTVVNLRRHMYDRVLQLPVAHFAQHGVNDLVSRFVQDSQDVYRGLNFVFAKSLREPLKALFTFGTALILDWRITLLAVVAAPLGALLIRKFGRRIRKANRRLLHNYGRMLAALEGALGGIRVVKGYGMEKYERRHLFSVDQAMLKQQLKISRVEAMSSPVFEMIGRVAATFAILYFAKLMLDGEMAFSKFAVLGACMAGMFDPIRKMSSFYNRMQRANAALDRVFEVIDLPVQVEDDHKKPALPRLADAIEFKNVSFTYPGIDKPALNEINLTVRRGERIAFVGPNGSGKTTLLSLLMRFFDPDTGTLSLDSRPVRDYSLASLRGQMSLITQDTVIFADTIANNIAYGDEQLLRRIVLRSRHPDRGQALDSHEQRITEAACAAYADEFIRDKPDGYDTLVGEHGATLSGGQKQRIAIARAILRNAPIFIFDEATSQVDTESEQKIHDAVEKFLEDRTALIIAHRFSTILQADRIVVMSQGRIVDTGPHDDLIHRCELYQSLYRNQIVENVSSAEG